MPQNLEQPGTNTGLDKFEDFELLISVTGQNFAATKPVKTDNGMEEKSLLEAILLERNAGGLNDTEAMALSIAWLAQNPNPEGKAFLRQELVRLKELNLFKNDQEVEALNRLLGQPDENQTIPESRPNQQEQAPPVTATSALEKHNPENLVQKTAGKIRRRVMIIAAAALALGAAASLWPTTTTAPILSNSVSPEPKPKNPSTTKPLLFQQNKTSKLPILKRKETVPPAPDVPARPTPIPIPEKVIEKPTVPSQINIVISIESDGSLNETASRAQWVLAGYTVSAKSAGTIKRYILTDDQRNSYQFVPATFSPGQKTAVAKKIR